MNYYFNYTSGLIDGLLKRTGTEDYVIVEGSTDPGKTNKYGRTIPREHILYSSLINKKVIPQNWIDTETMPGKIYDQSRNTGDTWIPIDGHKKSYLREWLSKNESTIFTPSTSNEVDYDKEYKSPFDNNIDKMLLILKWIAGIQSITGKTVEITREDLKAIDMEHKSTMDIKIAFDKIFPKSIVYSSYDSGTWSIKLGTRDIRTGNGPGYINMRINIPHLVENIETYHNDLQIKVKEEVS